MRPEPDRPAATKTPPAPSQQVVRKGELYPQHLGTVIRELPGQADEFDLIREELLAGYGYHTARAYWGDLEHWRDWCLEQEPAVEPLRATTADVKRYLDQMGEAGYSPNTRARRLTMLRILYAAVGNGDDSCNPTTVVPVIRRRRPFDGTRIPMISLMILRERPYSYWAVTLTGMWWACFDLPTWG